MNYTSTRTHSSCSTLTRCCVPWNYKYRTHVKELNWVEIALLARQTRRHRAQTQTDTAFYSFLIVFWAKQNRFFHSRPLRARAAFRPAQVLLSRMTFRPCAAAQYINKTCRNTPAGFAMKKPGLRVCLHKSAAIVEHHSTNLLILRVLSHFCCKGTTFLHFYSVDVHVCSPFSVFFFVHWFFVAFCGYFLTFFRQQTDRLTCHPRALNNKTTARCGKKWNKNGSSCCVVYCVALKRCVWGLTHFSTMKSQHESNHEREIFIPS